MFGIRCLRINIANTRLLRFISKLEMNQVYFKYNKDETPDKMMISLRYEQVNKNFNFARNITEPIEKTLGRIKNNVEKEINTKKRKKGNKKQTKEEEGESNREVVVKFYQNNDEVAEKTFEELLTSFEKSEDFRMVIDNETYSLNYNSPWIKNMTLPTSILAGFYLYPAKIELEFADRHASQFQWFRGKLPKSQREDDIEWEEIGSGFTYLSKSDDIGFRIMLKVTPKSGDGQRSGPAVQAISKNKVQAGPGYCPFECRHLFTENRLKEKSLRIGSYNILADYYADTEDGRTKLFAYCPQYAIDIDYRKQLLIKELVGYNTDILCLQEVDYKVFDLDLVPFLSEKCTMNGVHDKKGTTPEGLATFYRTDRFELIQSCGLNIGETVKTHSACETLFKRLMYNDQLVLTLTDRSTTLQVTLLKSKEFPEKYFLVANTHLYFHPNADHIRLLQFGFSMLMVEDFIEKFKHKYSTNDVSLLFCGDFNSVPECGIYKLMTENFVPSDFIDWRSRPEEEVKGVELSQPFQMQSATGAENVTNFTVGFKACLDYIFYQTDKFSAIKRIEMPSVEDLEAHIAIPSVVFPSDHIAILAELEIKA